MPRTKTVRKSNRSERVLPVTESSKATVWVRERIRRDQLEAAEPYVDKNLTGEERRLAVYCKAYRGVSDFHPEGRISQKEMTRRLRLQTAAIQQYESGGAKPSRIDRTTFVTLAKAGGWEDEELWAYVEGRDYQSSLSFEAIMARIEYSRLGDVDALAVLQYQIAKKIHELVVGRDKDDDPVDVEDEDEASGEPSFPQFNQAVLDRLAAVQGKRGMSDEKFLAFMEIFDLSADAYESIKQGAEITIEMFGSLAQVLDLSIDDLVKLRDDSIS